MKRHQQSDSARRGVDASRRGWTGAGRRAWVAAACAALALAWVPAARAQAGYRVPAVVSRIEVRELSNAVRVTIRADGFINLVPGPFWSTAWGEDETGHWRPLPHRRVPFYLSNCRSKVGAFYNIARYPVSHIELTPPADDPYGIGLNVNIVLYRPARVGSYLFEGDERERAWSPDSDPVRYDLSISPDKQSVVFTIVSDRFAQKPTARVTPGPGREERLALDYSDGQVSVTAAYVPLRRLLDEVSTRSGARILLEDGIERTVSMHLDGLALPDFLQAVTATYGLSLSRINGEWAVGEGVVTASANYLASETRRFPLRYLSPTDAVDLLPNFLVAYAHPDPEGNALVMSGPVPMLDKVAADLARVDVAPPQIEVQALVVELSEAKSFEGYLDLRDITRRIDLRSRSLSGDLTYRRVAATVPELRAQLRALEKRGAVRVHAEPKMTVVSGRTAELFVGQKKYIQVLRRNWRGERGELRAIPIGVTLSVTPWTGGAETTLSISPEVTTIDELDPATHLPLVGVRRCTGSLRVSDGDSVLISGLKLGQREATGYKLPILGDLPLVGALFRGRQSARSAVEYCVFVTAKVLG